MLDTMLNTLNIPEFPMLATIAIVGSLELGFATVLLMRRRISVNTVFAYAAPYAALLSVAVSYRLL